MIRGKTRKEPEVIKQSADEAREYAESIINTVREPLIVLDQDLRVVTVSRSFYEFFKVKPEETVGQLIYDLGNKQWDIPRLRELLETILPQKTTFDNYEVEHNFSAIGRRIMLLNARQIQRVLGKERIILLAIEDITERREIEAGLEKTRKELEVIKKSAAEDKLQESEEKYRLLAENARDIIWTMDMNLKFTYMSPSVLQIRGYTVEEVLAQSLEEIFTPSSLEIASKAFEEELVLESMEPKDLSRMRTLELEHICKDGSTVWVEINVSFIRDTDGQPIGILGVSRDITERRQTEGMLKAERQRLHDILEIMPMMVCLLTPDYHVAFANRAFRDEFGESHGRYCYEYCFGKKEPCDFCQTYNVLKTAKPHHWQITTTDNAKVIDLYDFPFTEVDGSSMILEVDIDITERQRLQEYLEKERHEFRLIVDSSPIIMFFKDQEGRFVRVNKTFAEALKIPEEEFWGKTVFDLYPAKIAQDMANDDQEVIKLGRPKFNIIEQYKSASGIRWVQTDKVPILDENGVAVGLLGFAQDITERKRAEDALRKSEAQYRLLAEHMTDTIRLMDMNLKTTYLSPSAAKLRGFTYQEILELPLEKQITPESLKPALKMFSEEIPRIEADPGYNPVRTLDLEYYRKDGTTVWAESSFSLIRDPSGKPISILAEARDITERKQAEEKLVKSYASLKKTLDDAIDTMAKIVETRDPYTSGHQHKVADLAIAIAREMKLEDTRIDQLRMAAVIHDIGKLYVPSDILSKPGKLSDIEFNLIKAHPQHGYDIVKGMDFPCNIAKAVLQHHERLDGSGYPNQLKGEDMILEAKILAVADVVEAMVAHRPYRPALGLDKALEEISKNKGKLYDPDVVDACVKLFKEKEFTLTGSLPQLFLSKDLKGEILY
ncbi:MAG: PAS domain S-box protein [Dehalococcoidia bacterium]|jgi:PAS domain S-box-containing protein/putative nucleotidyltransferase with HDIG domain